MADTEQPEKEQKVASNSASISQIAKKIDECDNILVTLSNNPSVDEMTAALGLAIFLDKLGKHATAIYSGRTPNMLQFLKPEDTFESNTNSLQDFIVALNKEKADHLRYSIDGDYVKIFITPYKTTIDKDDLEFSHGDYNVDLVIALNVPTTNDLDAALTEHGRIMHDASAIDITTGQPGKFGEIEWSDPTASSVSEMTADLVLSIQNAKNPINQASATAFLTGIVAETRRFSNEKTTPKTMSISSELMKLGADQQLVSSHLEEGDASMSNIDVSEEETDTDPTRLNIQHSQNDKDAQPQASDTDETPAPKPETVPPAPQPEPAPEPNPAPAAATAPEPAPASESNNTGEHGKPNLKPSPEMEAQSQVLPEPEFVAVSQPPASPPATPPVPPAPQPEPAPEPNPAPAAATAPEPAPALGEPNMLPPEPPLSGAVDLPPMAESATMSEAIPNETPPVGAMSDASLIASDKKPLDVPAPNDKDYGKMIDEALAETTLRGDAPIEPTQPLVTNMAVAAAPPVMEQPEANTVPDMNYNQAPVAPEQSTAQPVPVPNMETLPPPPPPPIPQIPDSQTQQLQPVPQPATDTQQADAPAPAPEPTQVPTSTPQTAPELVVQPVPQQPPSTDVSQSQPQAQQAMQPQQPQSGADPQQTDSPTVPPSEEMPAPTLTPDMFQIPGA